MRYSRPCAALLAVFVSLSQSAAAQEAATAKPIEASTLGAFLKRHKGPVLDVRMANDCPDDLALKRTTSRIAFDMGPDDPSGKKMAQDMFLSEVNANSALRAAKKTKDTVLVVCCAGGRSEAAASLLSSHGFRVVHVPGGMKGDQIPASILKSK